MTLAERPLNFTLSISSPRLATLSSATFGDGETPSPTPKNMTVPSSRRPPAVSKNSPETSPTRSSNATNISKASPSRSYASPYQLVRQKVRGLSYSSSSDSSHDKENNSLHNHISLPTLYCEDILSEDESLISEGSTRGCCDYEDEFHEDEDYFDVNLDGTLGDTDGSHVNNAPSTNLPTRDNTIPSVIGPPLESGTSIPCPPTSNYKVNLAPRLPAPPRQCSSSTTGNTKTSFHSPQSSHACQPLPSHSKGTLGKPELVRRQSSATTVQTNNRTNPIPPEAPRQKTLPRFFDLEIVASTTSAASTPSNSSNDSDDDGVSEDVNNGNSVNGCSKKIDEDCVNFGDINQDHLNQDTINQGNLNQDNINQDNLNEENINQDNIDQDNINQANINEDNLNEDSIHQDYINHVNIKQEQDVDDNLGTMTKIARDAPMSPPSPSLPSDLIQKHPTDDRSTNSSQIQRDSLDSYLRENIPTFNNEISLLPPKGEPQERIQNSDDRDHTHGDGPTSKPNRTNAFEFASLSISLPVVESSSSHWNGSCMGLSSNGSVQEHNGSISVNVSSETMHSGTSNGASHGTTHVSDHDEISPLPQLSHNLAVAISPAAPSWASWATSAATSVATSSEVDFFDALRTKNGIDDERDVDEETSPDMSSGMPPSLSPGMLPNEASNASPDETPNLQTLDRNLVSATRGSQASIEQNYTPTREGPRTLQPQRNVTLDSEHDTFAISPTSSPTTSQRDTFTDHKPSTPQRTSTSSSSNLHRNSPFRSSPLRPMTPIPPGRASSLGSHGGFLANALAASGLFHGTPSPPPRSGTPIHRCHQSPPLKFNHRRHSLHNDMDGTTSGVSSTHLELDSYASIGATTPTTSRHLDPTILVGVPSMETASSISYLESFWSLDESRNANGTQGSGEVSEVREDNECLEMNECIESNNECIETSECNEANESVINESIEENERTDANECIDPDEYTQVNEVKECASCGGGNELMKETNQGKQETNQVINQIVSQPSDLMSMDTATLTTEATREILSTRETPLEESNSGRYRQSNTRLYCTKDPLDITPIIKNHTHRMSIDPTALSIAANMDNESIDSLTFEGASCGMELQTLYRDEFSRLATRVKRLERKLPGTKRKQRVSTETSAFSMPDLGHHHHHHGYHHGFDAAHHELLGPEEAAKLRDRVKWLEKVLGIGRGANKVFEDEINDLRSKLAIVEKRLDEEMELREEATHKMLTLTNELHDIRNGNGNVEECLRHRIKWLESQLEAEKEKNKQSLSDVKVALAAADQLERSMQDKNEELERIRQTNQDLLKKKKALENDLQACAKDNDSLRASLLSLANDGSTKEQTLGTALSQLKSLSESYFHVQQELNQERQAREDEVQSLQWSLDDMSNHMCKMSERTHGLESENGSLREELRRLTLQKQNTVRLCRAARGY